MHTCFHVHCNAMASMRLTDVYEYMYVWHEMYMAVWERYVCVRGDVVAASGLPTCCSLPP